MSKTPTIEDWAKLKEHGYTVRRLDPMGAISGWQLLDPEGYPLMIGDHGEVSPTRYEAVAEGLRRIEQDERLRREQELGDPTAGELQTAITNRVRAVRESLESITDVPITDRLAKIAVIAEISGMLWPDGDSPVVWHEKNLEIHDPNV